jgi:hypothetical protein
MGNTCIHKLVYRYLFITISKYIKVNSNSFNHCRPNEHNPQKSDAQEWHHKTLEEQE